MAIPNNRKTVAVLTFHCAKNYGAVLQTYALCRVLQNRNFNVRIINLRPTIITGSITLNPVRWLSLLRFKNFERNYFEYFPMGYTNSQELKENPPVADYYIVGSDQVWNPEITRDFRFNYFFDFVPEGKRLISYAASFGKSELNIDENDRESIKKLLNRFDAVSVREDSGIKIAKEKFNIDAQQVIDPTLLLSDYSMLTGPLTNLNQIVCFKFNRNDKFYETLRNIGKILELPVKVLLQVRLLKGFKADPAPSVMNWVQSIGNSSFVITDSFHAVAFSIIFQKNFIVIPANINRFTRVESLLKLLGLEDRIFYTYDEIINDKRWLKKIDYQPVVRKLESLRLSANCFLDQALA
jgi:hypothetical protein